MFSIRLLADTLKVESNICNSTGPEEDVLMLQEKMNLETPLMSEMLFFCGFGPKSYFAVTKVLDVFRFADLQTMGPSRRRVGFCFVPCFTSGILLPEFKT